MKHITPFGDRILVKRQKIGETIGKSGIIVATDAIKERETDIAEVLHVPDWSNADKLLVGYEEAIVKAQTQKAVDGDAEALTALLKFNSFLKYKKRLVPGVKVFISKYVGVEFHDNSGEDTLTVVSIDDIIGVVDER